MIKVLYKRIDGVLHQKDLACEGSFGIPSIHFGNDGLIEKQSIDIINLRTGRKWETYAYATKDYFKASGGAANYFEIGDPILVLAWQYV